MKKKYIFLIVFTLALTLFGIWFRYFYMYKLYLIKIGYYPIYETMPLNDSENYRATVCNRYMGQGYPSMCLVERRVCCIWIFYKLYGAEREAGFIHDSEGPVIIDYDYDYYEEITATDTIVYFWDELIAVIKNFLFEDGLKLKYDIVDNKPAYEKWKEHNLGERFSFVE